MGKAAGMKEGGKGAGEGGSDGKAVSRKRGCFCSFKDAFAGLWEAKRRGGHDLAMKPGCCILELEHSHPGSIYGSFSCLLGLHRDGILVAMEAEGMGTVCVCVWGGSSFCALQLPRILHPP